MYFNTAALAVTITHVQYKASLAVLVHVMYLAKLCFATFQSHSGFSAWRREPGHIPTNGSFTKYQHITNIIMFTIVMEHAISNATEFTIDSACCTLCVCVCVCVCVHRIHGAPDCSTQTPQFYRLPAL